MRIDDNRGVSKLCEIDNGECFKWRDSLYIKFAVALHTEPGIYYTCVNLLSGNPVALGYGTVVEPVNAKVVIE